jgi:hypothetical protein
MNPEKLEYQCPYCHEWILKTEYGKHENHHKGDWLMSNPPTTLEELERRLRPLGYFDER